MATLLLTSLILFSFFTLSSPALPSSETILNAVEILSDSGFLSMALTLQLVSQTLIPQSSSPTIFSPSDAAFARSGQPPLILLQYHISPLKFSPENLKSLPFGTTIPTLLSNRSLIVTTSASEDQISINNVKINGSVIYDDGSLVIYGIDDFFDPEFQSPPDLAPEPSPSSTTGCTAPFLDNPSAFGFDSFISVADLLRSRGYSQMASFLDLQLRGFTDQTKLTIFAPVDEVIEEHSGNFSEYSSIFRPHVLPCRLTWSDLVEFDDGTILHTFLEGFTINITRSGDVLLLNGVPVIFPDMYYSDLLVVHGLRQMLTSQAKQEPTGDSFAGFNGNDEDRQPDYGEFGGP
ncbi:hypothetical protein HHK36_025175 [Tetracentron sinense]|uniref:FAS1 domain-containing protein n=1 Tax=Tetracentron sinense TaxID=13715 RepID=A0A835D4T0_TETSI|nr:hypothetical protein HHK36_025175 [Tetracentron sinense]